MRTLKDLELLKANEIRAWLLYIGPILFSFAVNEQLYERFMLLSYSVRLMMISTDYAEDAKRLVSLFLNKTKDQFGEEVFSSNVHSLIHLPWQLKFYGPIWSMSAMMFESANYLLQSKFTGTVNHLSSLVERYLRSKQSLKVEVVKDSLLEFCLSLRNTKRFCRKVVTSGIPESLLSPGTVFYSNCYHNLLWLDSKAHLSSKNSYLAYSDGSNIRYGQASIFFTVGGIENVSVEMFRVTDSYKCNSASNFDVYSYIKVEKLKKYETISVELIVSKCLLIKVSHELYLVPLLQMLEHD